MPFRPAEDDLITEEEVARQVEWRVIDMAPALCCGARSVPHFKTGLERGLAEVGPPAIRKCEVLYCAAMLFNRRLGLCQILLDFIGR